MAIIRQLEFINKAEQRPASYNDFLNYEIEGKRYMTKYHTLRNVLSKLMKGGRVERYYNSRASFFVLTGFKFGKRRRQELEMKRLSKVINSQPEKCRGLHDIHLKYTVPDIWKILYNSSRFKIIEKSNDILLPPLILNGMKIQQNIHQKDTVTVSVACSNNPVHISAIEDTEGVTSTTEEEYYKVKLPSAQKLSISKSNSKRLTSVYYYDLETFENLIYSIENRDLILYDILLHHFREGISLKREDDLLVPIGQLVNAGSSKEENKKKIRDIFQRLRHTMGPTTSIDSSKVKKDLLPFNINDKQRALIQRVNQLGTQEQG